MTKPSVSALISQLMREFPRHPTVIELYERMREIAEERAKAVNLSSANGVNKPVNKPDRKAYMRDYMRRRRAGNHPAG